MIVDYFVHDRETQASAVGFSRADKGIEQACRELKMECQSHCQQCEYRTNSSEENISNLISALAWRRSLACVQQQVEECSLEFSWDRILPSI